MRENPSAVANVFLWSSRISAARFCIGWWCGQHLHHHHAFGIWTPLNNIKVPFLWWNDNEKCMKKWQNSWTVNIFWMSDGIDEIMHRSASTKDDEQFNLHSVKNQWFGNQLPLLWWFLKRQHFEANYALHSNNFEEVTSMLKMLPKLVRRAYLLSQGVQGFLSIRLLKVVPKDNRSPHSSSSKFFPSENHPNLSSDYCAREFQFTGLPWN